MPSVTLMRKILLNAFTIGLVISLAKPHSAKQDVMTMKGRIKLTPSLLRSELLCVLSFMGLRVN